MSGRSPSWIERLGGLTGALPGIPDKLDLKALGLSVPELYRSEHLENAEERLALLRLLAVVINAGVYLVLMDTAGTRPELAYALIIGACVYGAAVFGFQRLRPGDLPPVGHVTILLDALLIATWIFATGGANSPFHVLWYASIASVAYRFDLLYVSLTSFLYVGLHVLAVIASGQLLGSASNVILHSAYIPLTGGLTWLLAISHADEREAHLAATARAQERALEATEAERQRIARVEEKWRSILEHAPEIVMMVDPEGRIEYCNLAETPEERDAIQGAPVTDWLPDHAHAQFRDALDQVLEQGETVSFEIDSRRPGGRPAAYLARIAPITKDGEIVAASLVSTDISRQRATERELEAYTKELERSRQMLGRYAELAAHDLREPLRDIARYAELLERESDELPGDLAEYGQFAVEGAKRLHDLVGGLRELSVLDRRELSPERLDLEALVDDAIASLTVDLEATGARVETEPMPEAWADPDAVQRVLRELIDNAITYGGPEPHVRVGAREVDGSILIHVEDDGPGIPEEFRGRAMEPFRRLVPWHETPGVGVGLAIVHRVVERHEGSVRLGESESGGARVELDLPAPGPEHPRLVGQTQRPRLPGGGDATV